MTPKIKIKELPITDRFLRQKRLIQDRGELALIEDGQSIQHLTYFSLKPGDGYCRGNHYHLKKEEHFYVVSGRLRLRLADVASGDKSAVDVHAGQLVTIAPGCAHRFIALEEAQVIEYYDTAYDPEDDRLYPGF